MKANDLLEVIKTYLLKKETDYAYMVTGGWGTGKTYFFKNRLPELKKKFHIISLFGIEKTEDVFERILESLISGYKWKNSISNRFSAIGNLIPLISDGDKNKIAKIFAPTDQELQLLKEFMIEKCEDLLVFDDLERISSKANMDEILSEIHKLVDELHNKVILVCNEEKLQNDDLYKTFKEKTIRYTISYEANVEDVLESYFTKINNKPYVDFLKSNRQILVDLINNAADRNLRTLNFIISTFEVIFNFLNKARFEICPEAKESFITKVFLFLSICSIEQKKGRDIKCIDLLNSYSSNFWDTHEVSIPENLDDFVEKTQIENEKIANEFSELYSIYSSRFLSLPEIVEYVYYGNIPNENFSKKKEQYQIKYKKQLESESQKVLRRLSEFRINDDNDFNEIINYLKNGEYSVEDILLIYKNFLYFRELDIINFDDKDFTNAMDSKPLSEFLDIPDNRRQLDNYYRKKMTEKSIEQYNGFSAMVYDKHNQIKTQLEDKSINDSLEKIKISIISNEEMTYQVVKSNCQVLKKENISTIMDLLFVAHSSTVNMFCVAIAEKLDYIDNEVLKEMREKILEYVKGRNFRKVFFLDLNEKLDQYFAINNWLNKNNGEH